MSQSSVEEGESFFDMLNREPETAASPPSSARLAGVTFSEDDGSGEGGVSARDFQRIELLEPGAADKDPGGSPARKLQVPRLAGLKAKRGSQDEGLGALEEDGQDPEEELTMEQMLQQLDEKKRADTERRAAPLSDERRRHMPLSARVRGRSLGRADVSLRPRKDSADSSVSGKPAVRKGRSRTMADVFGSIVRQGSKERVHEEDTPQDQSSVDESFAADSELPAGVAFSEFLEQEQDPSVDGGAPSGSDAVSPQKKGFGLTRSRNASVSGRDSTRKSPSIIARQSSGGIRPGSRGRASTGATSAMVPHEEDVGKLLDDPETCAAMMDFCVSALCDENLSVMVDLRDFRECSTEYLRRRLTEDIIRTYVRDDALRPINVDSRTRASLLEEYSALRDGELIPRELFDLFAKQIRHLVYTDILPRFWASAQYKTMCEGAALRQSVVGSCSAIFESLSSIVKLVHWESVAPTAEDEEELVDLWTWKDTSRGRSPSHYLRAAVRVQTSPEVLADNLSRLGDYSVWGGSLVEKSLLVKSFGSFMQVAQMQLGSSDPSYKVGAVLGSLMIHSRLESRFIALHSIPPREVDLPSGGSRFVEFGLSGFHITPESNKSCQLVCVLSLKQPSKKIQSVLPLKSMMMQLMSAIRKRDYLRATHDETKKWPDQVVL